MKRWLKYLLSDLGLMPTIDVVRYAPATAAWLAGGCVGLAPDPVKRQIISSYLRHFKLKTFVETGVYVGDTLAQVSRDRSVRCTSIELAEPYYRDAVNRFRRRANVDLLRGDSGELLPALVEALDAPALFWLDGHWSGGATAKGPVDSPISSELDAILSSPIRDHVVLIDDARCFDGHGGYPHLGELLETVRRSSGYRCEVSADIIRLTASDDDASPGAVSCA
ncbi:MAG: hypothetical protein ACRDQZ_25355 [Mycobacteriales bacterium]